jgi:hypothetical protein
MDRITNWQYSNNSYSTQKDYRYDIQNNLTFKTGAGNMTYNTANQLTSRIDNNTLTHTNNTSDIIMLVIPITHIVN